jgi:hypothetical protein
MEKKLSPFVKRKKEKEMSSPTETQGPFTVQSEPITFSVQSDRQPDHFSNPMPPKFQIISKTHRRPNPQRGKRDPKECNPGQKREQKRVNQRMK